MVVSKGSRSINNDTILSSVLCEGKKTNVWMIVLDGERLFLIASINSMEEHSVMLHCHDGNGRPIEDHGLISQFLAHTFRLGRLALLHQNLS